MTKETEKQERDRRKAAKERVKGWWDRPEHKPTKEDDEATRDGDISDPAKQGHALDVPAQEEEG